MIANHQRVAIAERMVQKDHELDGGLRSPAIGGLPWKPNLPPCERRWRA